MEDVIDVLRTFYQIDSTTVLLIVLFCGTSCYFIRPQLNNPASVWILCPIFVLVAMTTYVLAAQLHLFSPKKNVEWITYTTFSASIGAIMGILLVAVYRLIQDRFITASHIRSTLRRDEEQASRGYPQADV